MRGEAVSGAAWAGAAAERDVFVEALFFAMGALS
jgi:hypothetical protein